ncbi:17791_t:CDS:2 [Cetraspora pellucida]|uniref:17791_t:CDS:1 n=1 Tax=Cetraspora pellucida TaxID=1433469 RepID=A0A9N9NNW9_9GLOM|nr:17791_t:CDS:2 [Cetraspora pellucida]
MSDQENSQQPAQDVAIPVEYSSDNGAKDKEEELKSGSSNLVEKSAIIDDLPSYEHATTDATPAYSVSDPSHKQPDSSAVASTPQRRGTSRRARCCCLISSLIAISIILAVISKTNSNICNNLNAGTAIPNISSYDPNVFTSFTIDSSDTAVQNGGSLSLRTYQNPSPDVTNVTINTRVASPKQGNVYVTDDPSNSNYKLTFKSISTDSFNLFGPPNSCFRALVDLIIPQQSNSSMVIGVDNFDVILGNFSYQFISVRTTTGDIHLNRFNVTSATLYSEQASIHGRITSLSNTLIVNQTSNGDINLTINIANATSPKIYVNANRGRVRLRMNKTFAGTYNVMTSGKVLFSTNRRKTPLPSQGSFGNGTALLEVISNHDVIVGF